MPANNQYNDAIKMLMALGLADAAGDLLTPARIDPTSNASGTVQSTVYTLNTVTLPAAFLNNARRGFIAIGRFTTAANANAKDITVKLGSTALLTITGSTANAKSGIVIVVCHRTAANTQAAFGLAIVDNALVAITNETTAAETEANALAVTLNAANTAAAAASATGDGLIVLPFGN